MIIKEAKKEVRNRRRIGIRNKVHGTNVRPRLAVFRSNTNIYAQIIDDNAHKTLVSASSLDKDLNLKSGANIEAAVKVGESLAKKAKKAKINTVTFDRGGFLYHGRVKALADAVRDGGIEF